MDYVVSWIVFEVPYVAVGFLDLRDTAYKIVDEASLITSCIQRGDEIA
jgi:hypothetical protein